MKTRLLMGIALAAIMHGGAAAGPTPKMLGDTCAGCHGLKGASAGLSMPTIAGMPADFIVLSMREYREGKRGSTIMGRIAKGYTDEDFEAMARYFSSQPWKSAKQEFSADLAKLGKRVHQRKCEACHRDNGISTEQDMPRMAGQWREYLGLVLDESRKRNFHQSETMKAVMERLSEQEVTALTHFYASQR
ncbi:MAG: cytochrome c4 [Betaproteobacteria bacterium]|nr:cytochrome c4 [Betaproteobacteria bacterium]